MFIIWIATTATSAIYTLFPTDIARTSLATTGQLARRLSSHTTPAASLLGFPWLGSGPLLGRCNEASDLRRMWQRRVGGNRDVVGPLLLEDTCDANPGNKSLGLFVI